jgi:hypothetical protein
VEHLHAGIVAETDLDSGRQHGWTWTWYKYFATMTAWLYLFSKSLEQYRVFGMNLNLGDTASTSDTSAELWLHSIPR